MTLQKQNSLKPAFIGDANWDLHLSEDDPKYLRSVPKPNVCKSIKESNFGDKLHVLRLMRMGYFDGEKATEIGLQFLEGLHSSFCFREDGTYFSHLSFNNDY